MKISLRLSLVLTGLFTLLVGATYAAPGLAESWGLDFWNLPKLHNAIREIDQSDKRMAIQGECTRRRQYIREGIVGDLLASRLEMKAAIEQFIELNSSNPTTTNCLRISFPNCNERQLATHQLQLFLSTCKDAVADAERMRFLEAEIDKELNK